MSFLQKEKEYSPPPKDSFVLFVEFKEVFDALSDEQAGILIKAIFEYEATGTFPEIEKMLGVVAIPIKNSLKRNRQKWVETCRKRSEAGKMGGRPKKANGFSENQTDANKADSDSGHDYELDINTHTHDLELSEYKFFGDFQQVRLSEQDYQSFIGRCLSKKLADELIQEFDNKLESGLESIKIGGHLARLCTYLNRNYKKPAGKGNSARKNPIEQNDYNIDIDKLAKN